VARKHSIFQHRCGITQSHHWSWMIYSDGTGRPARSVLLAELVSGKSSLPLDIIPPREIGKVAALVGIDIRSISRRRILSP
jgi:hypothetical protein